jgi:phage shock protein B
MSSVIIVAIIFGSIVTLASLICGTVLVIVKMRHSGLSASGRKANKDEVEMIQEMYRGLERMEQRIDALETILMDKQHKNGDGK